MADLDLTVKLLPEVDSNALQAAIAKEVNAINANPQKVKIQLDDAQIKQQIANISSQLKQLSQIKITPGGGAGNAGGTSELVKGTIAYNNALNKVNKALAEVHSNSRKWTASQSGSTKGDFANYTRQAQELEKLKASLETGSMKAGEFAQRYSDISTAMTTAASNIKIADENMKATSATNQTLVKNTKEYNDALTKLNSMLLQVNTNSEKWSKAKTGKASGFYDDYVKQAKNIQDIINNLESYTPEKLKAAMSEISAAMKTGEVGIKTLGEDSKSIFDSLGGSFKRFAQYFGMSRVIMAGVQKIKEMARASIEVESAMNRIQIVTGASDSQMTSFFQSATAQAKELGQSITDVAKSLEDFSRLGYGLSEASELSKYATIMSNVADTSVEQATTGITSIIKGYGLDVSDTEHVADVLIKVGQEYAISAEELMESFSRGGASMAAANTSFEESAALFAATNASLDFWRVA